MNNKRYGHEADLKAIDKVREQHVAALNAGDANAWVAEFADDGVQMPPTPLQILARRRSPPGQRASSVIFVCNLRSTSMKFASWMSGRSSAVTMRSPSLRQPEEAH
jgi:hypothetical protein